jgi:hypothetical protein
MEDNQGFRLFRPIERGEFFVVFGDCSQGGADSNFVQFMSKTRGDIPLVFQKQGVARQMSPRLREALVWIYKTTGIKPVVALERNNGGASEMDYLVEFNDGSYEIFYMKDKEGKPILDKPGWDTTETSRPAMLGDWLVAYESREILIYDEITQEQHQTFIVNAKGKPEAAVNTHDDGVMSAAGAYQLYKTENPKIKKEHRKVEHKRLKLHTR